MPIPRGSVKQLTEEQRKAWSACCDAIDDIAGKIATRHRSSELLKILHVLRCVRQGVMPDTVQAPATSLGERLRQAVVSMEEPGYRFEDTASLYETLRKVPKETFKAVYPFLVDRALHKSAEFCFHSVVCPPRYFARTVAGAVTRPGCRSVLNRYAGIRTFGWALPAGIAYKAEEESPLLRLIGEVTGEALGPQPVPWPEGERPDALVATLPIDYSFNQVNKWETYEQSCYNIQRAFLEEVRSGAAVRMAAGVFHFKACNGFGCQELRKELFESGHVETVVTFPDSSGYNILPDADVITSLVIFDFTKRHDTVRFITAGKIIADLALRYGEASVVFNQDYDIVEMADGESSAIVPMQGIRDTDYAFNAYLHVQDIEILDGQKLVRMSDLAEMVVPSRYESREGRIARWRDLSYEVATACTQIPVSEGKVYAAIPVDGESILFQPSEDWRISARISRDSRPFYVEEPMVVLKPKNDAILPEYLISVLLTDRKISAYVRHISEYYVDGFRRSHLMHMLVPIYPDLEQQRQSVEIFLQEKPEEIVFNAVSVGLDAPDVQGDALMKDGVRVIRSLGSASELASLLDERKDNPDLGTSFEVIIADSRCPLGKDGEEPFDGLDEVITLHDRYGIPVFLLSDIQGEEFVQASGIKRRRLEYFLDGSHLFPSGDVRALGEAIRAELGSNVAEDVVVRNRFASFFEAADWYDRTFGQKTSDIISSFLLDDGEARPFNDIRILTESVIRTLQGLNVIPPELDPGAVPKFIYERRFEDKNKGGRIYYLTADLMPKYLSSAIVTLYEVGRPGSHTMLEDRNMGKIVVNAFMALLEWFYSSRERFSSPVFGFYDVQNPNEEEYIFEGEYRGTVQCDVIDGREYYYSGEFHLQVEKSRPQVRAGDTVIVRRAKKERQVKKEGVTKYASKADYHKVDA